MRGKDKDGRLGRVGRGILNAKLRSDRIRK